MLHNSCDVIFGFRAQCTVSQSVVVGFASSFCGHLFNLTSNVCWEEKRKEKKNLDECRSKMSLNLTFFQIKNNDCFNELDKRHPPQYQLSSISCVIQENALTVSQKTIGSPPPLIYLPLPPSRPNEYGDTHCSHKH